MTINQREASISDFAHHSVSIDGKVFDVAGDKWLAGVYDDSSPEIFPGIMQHTREFADFKIDLYRELSAIPVCFSEEDGWHYAGAGQVLVDWGAKASHVLPPFEDNSQLRNDLELRDPDEDEIKLIKALFRHVLKNGKGSALRIKDISNSGFPYMQPGREFKHAIYRRAYANAEALISMTAQHDWERRLSHFGSYPAFTNGIRVQADSVKDVKDGRPVVKTRYSYPLEDIRNGSLSDASRFPIDMRVFINGEHEPRLVASRVRSIYALSYDDNCILQAINAFIANGLKTIPCCDYRGEIVESERVRDYLGGGDGFVVSLDKSQFGETFSPFLSEILLEVLGEFFLPEVVEYIRVTYDAVTFFRCPAKGKKEVQAVRPTISKDPSLSLRGSLKSGHAMVAAFGKLYGLADLMLIVRRAFPKSFSLERFLENKISAVFYSSFSDDTKAHFRYAADRDAFIAAVESGASLHKDELEICGNFLGWIYNGNGSYGVNMSKLLESLTGVERSYKLKTYHADGIKAKLQRYSVNPLFSDIFDIVNTKYREHFDFDLYAYCQRSVLQGVSVDDALFLDDPDKIFYYPNLNPSQELVDAEFASIELEEVNSLLSKLTA